MGRGWLRLVGRVASGSVGVGGGARGTGGLVVVLLGSWFFDILGGKLDWLY